MKLRAATIGMVLALGACSAPNGDTINSSASANDAAPDQNAALANYVPPSVTSRADFGGVIERRFHRADANADDKLTVDELPGRNAERLLGRYDKDGNGSLDSSEWGTLMLERFDRLDANKDGSVTSKEREAMRAARGAGARAGAEPDAALDEAENVNTM